MNHVLGFELRFREALRLFSKPSFVGSTSSPIIDIASCCYLSNLQVL